MKMKHYDRCITMIEKVLEIDAKNEKALLRKCDCLIEQGNFQVAE